MKKILIVSDIPILNMKGGIGIKVLYKTIERYALQGWTISVVYPAYESNLPKELIFGNNVSLYPVNTNFYFKISNKKYISYLSKCIFWIYYFIKIRVLFYKKFREKHFDIAYGIGPLGAFIISRINFEVSTPLKVGRFLGIASAEVRYNSRFKRILTYPDLFGYRAKLDTIIMTNDGTRGIDYIRKVRKDNIKVLFLRNGIDKELFRNVRKTNFIIEKYNLPIGTKIILAVSRLSKLKRLDRVISVFSNIVSRYSNVRLVIVGDGALREELKRIGARLGVGELVIFAGGQKHDELIKFYNSADIFISLYDTSNAGNPLFEAMLSGNCVVTLAEGNTSDFISNNEGVIIKKSEMFKLPDILVDLLNDDNRRELLSKSAATRALNEIWDWNERIDREINELTSLLSSRYNLK